PQLSCELCRDRKVKCDKLDPCTYCVSHGVECKPVQRLRLPRGRHAPRSKHMARGNDGISEDLKQRIHNLEGLINDMRAKSTETETLLLSQVANEREMQTVQTNHPPHNEGAGEGHAFSSTSSESHIPTQRPETFWENLAAEVNGLRDVVESALDDAEDDSAQALGVSQMGLTRGDMATIGLVRLHKPSSVSQDASAEESSLFVGESIKRQLCHIYLRQVDPIIKILHRPSLEAWIIHGQGYFGYPDKHPTTEALSTAVYFSAASSLTEKQCEELFQMPKSTMTSYWRTECEIAIDRSNLLATRDINVLEAFVLYLYARRTEDRSKAVWTLIAVAVRVARGLSLHLPATGAKKTERFFDQQMRLRLWLTICRLDMQSLFIQATEPLIGHEEVRMSLDLLKNINDSDFDTKTVVPVESREGLTDMTFALVSYHLQLVSRLLVFLGYSEKINATGGIDWATRQQYARQFEQKALRLLDFCDPESSAYAWFTWHGTQCLVAGIRLSLLRPLYSQSPPPPRSGGDSELLLMSLSVLEKTQLMHTDPRGEAYRWYIAIPWHVVAIAIAECFVSADTALIRRAWPVIEASYQQHEAIIARHKGGLLQGPLGKLMQRTRERLA
ncbi:hypothetical protein BGZ63DRAFT_338983, partial [Mariannaea sp. PMI_226]